MIELKGISFIHKTRLPLISFLLHSAMYMLLVKQAEIDAAGVSGGDTGGDVAAADAPDSDDDMGDHYDAGTSPQHRSVVINMFVKEA